MTCAQTDVDTRIHAQTHTQDFIDRQINICFIYTHTNIYTHF